MLGLCQELAGTLGGSRTLINHSYSSPFSDSPAAKQEAALRTLVHPVPPLLALPGKPTHQLQAEIWESQN